MLEVEVETSEQSPIPRRNSTESDSLLFEYKYTSDRIAARFRNCEERDTEKKIINVLHLTGNEVGKMKRAIELIGSNIEYSREKEVLERY